MILLSCRNGLLSVNSKKQQTMCMVKVVAITIKTTTAEVEVVEVEAGVANVEKIGLGILQIITIITITIKDHLMHLRRHQALSSRLSPRGPKTTLKVRGIILLWLMLLKMVFGAYENLEFDKWNEIEN